MKLIDCEQNCEFYRLIKDDDLNTIINKFNITASAIIRNNDNVDFYEGEVVKIVRNNGLTHVVKPMETLASISNVYGVEVSEIIKLNNLKSSRLFIGQKLIIKN